MKIWIWKWAQCWTLKLHVLIFHHVGQFCKTDALKTKLPNKILQDILHIAQTVLAHLGLFIFLCLSLTKQWHACGAPRPCRCWCEQWSVVAACLFFFGPGLVRGSWSQWARLRERCRRRRRRRKRRAREEERWARETRTAIQGLSLSAR